MISLIIGQHILEKYFFDSVIYQKWSWYGYVPNEISFNLVGAQDQLSWPIHHRLRDLIALQDHAAKDVPFAEKENSRVFKVAFIGDSFVFGQGLLEHERISSVLERKLNTLRPTKVYTFAQLADDQLDYYANYLLAEKYLQPDMYIIGMVWNDFETWGGKVPIEDEIRARLQEKCPLPEYREHFSPESSSWLQIIRDHTYQTISPAHSNRCYMNEFVKDITAHEKVVFFNFNRFTGPQWCEEGDALEHIYQGFVLNLYENIIHANRGTIVGIDVENWNNWESVTETEAHPSKKMHRLGAEILFEEIINSEKWTFRFRATQ